jgi:hypothetical protein
MLREAETGAERRFCEAETGVGAAGVDILAESFAFPKMDCVGPDVVRV